ncbi:hypothetical protein BDN72DRAFT_880553 [Pluteus cervinus]|uniref:Uncharacterized protein n=1 Tax=Pluteus cervinus TaxID=181527 RepID=A0ACD3AJX1_9AGAR|nr:hypothetical protein BDN72DRAFT_880553 [Pluteus cervinus]
MTSVPNHTRSSVRYGFVLNDEQAKSLHVVLNEWLAGLPASTSAGVNRSYRGFDADTRSCGSPLIPLFLKHAGFDDICVWERYGVDTGDTPVGIAFYYLPRGGDSVFDQSIENNTYGSLVQTLNVQGDDPRLEQAKSRLAELQNTAECKKAHNQIKPSWIQCLSSTGSTD